MKIFLVIKETFAEIQWNFEGSNHCETFSLSSDTFKIKTDEKPISFKIKLKRIYPYI